jgi:hypothetical protein
MKLPLPIGFAALLCAAYQPLAGLPFVEWNFESYTSANSTAASFGPLAPEVGSGSATGVHSSATTVWSNPAGNGSAESFSANTWNPGDYFQFTVNSTSLTGLASGLEFSWDQTSSSTGPKSFTFSYSTDGTTFTQLMAYSVLANSTVAAPDPQARSAWSSGGARQPIYNFSTSVSGLIGEPTVHLRIANAEPASSASGGTSRLDNFAINYTAVPEPEEWAAIVGVGLVGFALWRRRC